jgi:hypothetical protein
MGSPGTFSSDSSQVCVCLSEATVKGDESPKVEADGAYSGAFCANFN